MLNLCNRTGLTRSNSQLVPPTPPPIPKPPSISGSKRDKNSHDNQGTDSISLLLEATIYIIAVPKCTFISLTCFFLYCLLLRWFFHSLSGRRLYLVLHLPHWQWGASVRTLGGQHHLGWPGDGSHAHPTCTHSRSQWWEYHSRYAFIQKSHVVSIHVQYHSTFFQIWIFSQRYFKIDVKLL